VWDFPHLVIACELYFSPRAKRLFVITWVPLARILCGGIPFSVIALMTLLFIGYCFMALGIGYWVLFYGAEFIFDVPFIIMWVNICFLYMREILG